MFPNETNQILISKDGINSTIIIIKPDQTRDVNQNQTIKCRALFLAYVSITGPATRVDGSQYE